MAVMWYNMYDHAKGPGLYGRGSSPHTAESATAGGMVTYNSRPLRHSLRA